MLQKFIKLSPAIFLDSVRNVCVSDSTMTQKKQSFYLILHKNIRIKVFLMKKMFVIHKSFTSLKTLRKKESKVIMAFVLSLCPSSVKPWNMRKFLIFHFFFQFALNLILYKKRTILNVF